MEHKTVKYDVYLLDMYAGDSEYVWVENARTLIGSVRIPAENNQGLRDVTVLSALYNAVFSDTLGRAYHPLETKDRRMVYAEDYYGDGQWWEVGSVREHCPIFGLAPVSQRRKSHA